MRVTFTLFATKALTGSLITVQNGVGELRKGLRIAIKNTGNIPSSETEIRAV